MQSTKDSIIQKHLVLVGGGHTHVGILKAWAMNPVPDTKLTLISPSSDTYYSGMLPGVLAGDFSTPEICIDLDHLALKANAVFYRTKVLGIDPQKKILFLENYPNISYDFVSFDVGSQGKTIPGISDFISNKRILATRPFTHLLKCLVHWDNEIMKITEKKRILCVGAGAAGWEIVVTLQTRYREQWQKKLLEFVILDSGSRTSKAMEKVLHSRNIHLENESRVKLVQVVDQEFYLTLENGKKYECDYLIWSAGPAPINLFQNSELASPRGYLWVNEYLQSPQYKNIFGAGDCIDHQAYPQVDKAGVFAVRELPILNQNLRAALAGARLQKFKPQKIYLRLLNTGKKSAILQYGWLEWHTKIFWNLKKWIDTKFMKKFQIVALPPEEDPNCGACGAKVASDILYPVLGAIPHQQPHDDIAIRRLGESEITIATDHLKNFSINLFELGSLAAFHALNDFYAKAQVPAYATVNIVLKRAKQSIAADDFKMVMAGIQKVFSVEGIEIVGGQTTFGMEEHIGITFVGQESNPCWKKQGLYIGDQLILTRALGTGIILAARMRFAVSGKDFDSFLGKLLQSQRALMEKMRDFPISAATDITGFGFYGHLREMMDGSPLKLKINSEKIPIHPLAKKLSLLGYKSRMQAENERAFFAKTRTFAEEWPQNPIFYDPQTAGGFLFGVSGEEANDCLAAIREIASDAEIIGKIL